MSELPNAVMASKDQAISAALASLSVDHALAFEPPINLALRLLNMETAKDAKAADDIAVAIASHSPWEASWLLPVRQAAAMLRKNVHLTESCTPDVREQACFDKFYSIQKHNRISERRVTFYRRHPSRMSPTIRELVERARLDIFRLLGPSPDLEDWRMFDDAKVMSSGTIQGLKPISRKRGHGRVSAKDTSIYGKLSSSNRITATAKCIRSFGPRLFRGSFGDYIRSNLQRCDLVESAAGTTVFKEAEIDRFIAVGALINGICQQGVRAMLERRLRRWGVTLDKQSRNQELACVGSMLGFGPSGFSTIDQTSASDCMINSLIEWFLPVGWYRILDDAREPSVTIKGAPVPGYASFCTMGNAFTFPLQCLIFASLTRAAIAMTHCPDHRYRVYGDDIIVPTGATLLLLEVLRFVGFIPNKRKSHITGNFRESCGGDFLLGENVTPVKLVEQPSLRTTQHVLFNLLQRKFTSHPVLSYLLELHQKPLVGLALDRDSVAEGYFEAPPHIVGKVGSARYRNDIQAYEYRFVGLKPQSMRLFRSDENRRRLAQLCGEYGLRHDLRGTVSYHVREFRVSVFYRHAVSPIWFDLT